MYIAIFSDLHGNPEVLQFLIDRVFTGVDQIWSLGDNFHIYDKGETSKSKADQVIKTLSGYKTKPIDYIKGNCDEFEDYESFAENYATTPFVIKDIEGQKMLLTHGHQFSAESDAITLLREQGVSVLVYGHTHLSELAIKDDLVFINPGSVTLP
ncbi:YfcE family phosphodiesterase, partial [Candidatus Magnetaquicoccus inordinatus]|uniref:YfcE family phosphodiesterase n=1 Tax=Candidatus Magnetaquicoccus inordinatus TaxID=2496818 RepID=UPI00187D3716